MKYALIDNAVVQCDDIRNYIMLDTSKLFESNEYRLLNEYRPVFDVIKTFLTGKGICELFVSTHFYFIPCFVKELQLFIGENIHVVPINIIANNQNMAEHYCSHTIKTIFDNGFWRCTIFDNDVIQRVGQVVDRIPIPQEIGVPFIININDYIDHLEGILSMEDFCELVMGDNIYQQIVVGEEDFLNFSPFGSLRYYDELKPKVHGFDIFHTTEAKHFPQVEYNYVMSTFSGDVPFKNQFQTWINTEKGGSFPIKCLQNNTEKLKAVMIPDSIIEENEIQINDMRFGKFYVEMECDFLGNLHLSIESLSGKTFYQILQFAL